MCRDRNNGGRRCPHDTNETRRTRRVNAKLVKQYGDVAAETVDPPLSQEVDNDTDRNTLIVDASRAVSEYNEILDRIGPPPAKPVFHSEQLTEDEILAEQKLIEIGNHIDSLSRHYDYPCEDDIHEISQWINDNNQTILNGARNIDNEFRSKLGVMMTSNKEGVCYGKSSLNPSEMIPIEAAIEERLDYLQANGADEATLATLRSDYEAWQHARNESNKEMAVAKDNFRMLITKRANAYRQALVAVGVEFAGTDDLVYIANNPVDSKDIKEAGMFYPKSWVTQSNSLKKKLSLMETPGVRANYDDATGVISFDSKQDDASIILHELGHRMEHSNREVSEAERRFLNRRAGFVDYHNGITQRIPEDDGIKGQYERGYFSAGFATDYASKVYDINNQNDTPQKRSKYIAKYGALKGKGYFEILTIGMESTFYGNHGGGIGLGGMKTDIEHTRFVLGLIASSVK